MLNGKIYNCQDYIYMYHGETQLLNIMVDLYSPTLDIHLYHRELSQNNIEM